MAEVEYGVEMPNGEVQWGVALGRPVGTPEERATFLQVMKNTAAEVKWPEDKFVAGYQWRKRDVQVYADKTRLDAPEVTEPAPSNGH